MTQVRKFGRKSKHNNLILYIAILALVLIFSVTTKNFFSGTNLKAILQSMATLSVLAFGETFILSIGETDISNGAMLSLSPVIFAALYMRDVPFLPALILGILATLALGLLNALVIVKAGLPSFIGTLGVSGVAMGLTRIIANNKPILMEHQGMLKVFGGETAGIPNAVLWMAAMLLIGDFIIRRTRFGRNLLCIGDNREAAMIYGIRINRHVILAFLLDAVFVTTAGFMECCRSTYVTAGVGEALVLNSIVASVIGGTAVSGGRANMIGTFMGALFITIVANGLFMFAISPYLTNIIVGLVIIVVLTGNALMSNREQELKRT